MTTRTRLTPLLLCGALACSPEPGPSPDVWDQPFAGALADTRSRVITSSVNGRTYQVSVALPGGYETSDEAYPVLYAVDANGEFGTLVEASRLLRIEKLVPELLIVGIGYPVGPFSAAMGTRAVDLTPTEDRDWEKREAVDFPEFPAPEGSGGAPDFLRVLQQEVIPSIDAEFRTIPQDRALFGHSFGGLFAIHALLNGQGTFRRFIVGSASLWWDREVTFAHEAAFAAKYSELPARVFFSAGALEDQDPDLYWGHMASDLRRFVDVVEGRRYDGLVLQLHVFENETHTSVIPATISRGLRYAYEQ